MMNPSDIEERILRELYEARFSDHRAANLFALRDEEQWHESLFWRIEDRLVGEGLIRGFTAGGNYVLTSEGVVEVERRGIAPHELSKENGRIRTAALDALAKAYEEQGRRNCTVSIEHLSEVSGFPHNAILRNLEVLMELDYAEAPYFGHFRIADRGMEAVQEWRQQTALANEFERVSEMKPQPRGKALQKVFATVVEQNGWMQEEGVRTSHEEMDVIIYQDRAYYLVECKWEQEPIEANVVRELLGKLRNRAGVEGIVVSMSGFTKGATEQVREYRNDRLILLFGQDDVHSLIYERASFDALLEEKTRMLVTRGIVVFK